MTTDPDRIRSDIERTRSELSSDVDALTDKVSPSRIAERQTEKVKDAMTSVKEKVMGVADDARTSTSEATHAAAAKAADAPDAVRSSAAGNPLAAGLIAFGAGLLAASLIPSTRKEQELVTQAKESDAVHQVAAEAKSMAQSIGEDMKQPAMDAAQAVKDSATAGAQEVRDTAAAGADEVRTSGQHAANEVGQDVTESRERLQGF